MRSINRITQFFSSKEAVSRDVALQTAAALQVRITLCKFSWFILDISISASACGSFSSQY